MKRILAAVMATTSVAAAGCSLDSTSQSAGQIDVVIGYQSKTINTVTAGTLLKAKGFLEQRLADITKSSGVEYNVQWQDYDTGAPITAQMVAEKIDIGSMGDYPLLINGSKTQANERAKTELVSVTGYSPTGALNMVVVPPNSAARTLTDLKGQKVSTSVGSAGHGTLVRALDHDGIDPATGAEVLNQQPQVGASALESGQAQALSQFVAWPGLLVFQNKAKLLYDGAEGGYPTFHGVVVRRDYASRHPEVLDAFLQAQLDATEFLNGHPLESAKIVADGSGLPQGSSTSTTAPAARRSTPL
jgi:NitT/TauT family transport system substrate-binding protein